MFKFGRGIVIDEIDLGLASVNVQIGQVILRAIWTPESVQDIRVFHSIDAEAELTAILASARAYDIDREIIRELRLNNQWIKENILKIKSFKFGR
jgi:hypothetical protein